MDWLYFTEPMDTMKQFLFDVFRGVMVGIIVWYILRPDEPAFHHIGDAIVDSKALGERFFDALMGYPSEQLGLATGCGLILGTMIGLARSRSKRGSLTKAKPLAKKR